MNALRRLAQQDIGAQNNQRSRRRVPELSQAAEYADPGRTPQRGGGIEAADVHAIAHNHPCPKKADTGDDLRCNTPRAVRRGRHRAENKHRRAGGHQGIGA